MYNEIQTKEILILGCGNILFGDDAFGPQVVEKLLASGRLPETAFAEDVGTSVRDVLFNLVALPEKKPSLIIVVDAVQLEGHTPGEVFEIDISQMPKIKIVDFSFHQCPTTNLLHEARELRGINVRIVAGQAACIPEELAEGLSPEMSRAVDGAVELVLKICREHSQR
jgi:coenzyme F420 hydrogenase subunit delta